MYKIKHLIKKTVSAKTANVHSYVLSNMLGDRIQEFGRMNDINSLLILQHIVPDKFVLN